MPRKSIPSTKTGMALVFPDAIGNRRMKAIPDLIVLVSLESKRMSGIDEWRKDVMVG